MARIAVVAMPFAGHVSPVAAVARELIDAGHEVIAYTGSRYASRFSDLGADTIQWSEASDFDERDLTATFPEVGRRGPAGLLANVEHVFIRTGIGQARDLQAEHARQPFDLIAGDVLSLGAGLAAELLDIPWATISVVPLSLPSVDLPPTGFAMAPGSGVFGHARNAALRAVVRAGSTRLDRAHADVRRALGLPVSEATIADAWYSPWLVLATGCPSIEYPRSDLGRQFHFVGRLSAAAAPVPTRPDWWSELETTTAEVVLITQGTFNVDPGDLIEPAMAALGASDVFVTATTAGVSLPDAAIPSNARVAAFLPFADLLPRTSAVVTNGGWGGILEFLASGVPLIVAGGDLDKPEIAARVAWSGAGIDLRTGRPSPQNIRRAFERLSRDATIRRRAGEIGDELRALGGASRAAELIGELLASREPVLGGANPWGLTSRR